jgi:curved DNA-binding protein CbpA
MAEGGPCRCGRGTLYDVLQVSPWCEHDVIQAAYRALARTRHPDVNHERDAEDQMRRLNVAYQTLSDPVQRARYDEELALEAARIVTARPAGPPPAAGPRVAAGATAGPGARSAAQSASAAGSAQPYQAMIFDQRGGESLFSRSALYLLVVLITVVLTLMVYIIVDFLAAERPLSPQQQRPRSQLEPSRSSSDPPGTWLFEGADADARPGLSPSGDRWNR